MITCFGSINLDLIFPVGELPAPGHTVLGATMHIQPGGKGANQAVAAARDGATVVFAGAVGHDALAEQALALLREAGVQLGRVTRAHLATGCAAICVDPDGRNQIAVASGANLLAHAHQVEDALLGPGHVLLCQGETDAAETAALIRRAAGLGARTVFNLAPAAAFEIEALRAVHVLVLNGDEAAWLGTHLGSGVNAASLHAALGVAVVVTLGESGVEAASAAGHLRMDGIAVRVVDTTAAGDCFTGVLAAALDRGATLEAAIRRANIAASLACTRAGSQGSLPTAAETDAAQAGRLAAGVQVLGGS